MNTKLKRKICSCLVGAAMIFQTATFQVFAQDNQTQQANLNKTTKVVCNSRANSELQKNDESQTENKKENFLPNDDMKDKQEKDNNQVDGKKDEKEKDNDKTDDKKNEQVKDNDQVGEKSVENNNVEDTDENKGEVVEPLVVDAGRDRIIKKYNSLCLGSYPTAKGGAGEYTYEWKTLNGEELIEESQRSLSNPEVDIENFKLDLPSKFQFQVTVKDKNNNIETDIVEIEVIDKIIDSKDVSVKTYADRKALNQKEGDPITWIIEVKLPKDLKYVYNVRIFSDHRYKAKVLGKTLKLDGNEIVYKDLSSGNSSMVEIHGKDAVQSMQGKTLKLQVTTEYPENLSNNFPFIENGVNVVFNVEDISIRRQVRLYLVKDGQIFVKKVDENGNQINGAEFSLKNIDTGQDYRLIQDMKGIFRVVGLPIGKYELKEIKAPDGYILDSNPKIMDVSLDSDVSISGVITIEYNFVNKKKDGPSGPGISKPNTEKPDVSNPGTNKPDTEKPDVSNPGINKPDTEKPNINNPGTNKPDTEKPNINNPGTNKPDTEKPNINNPGTENPDTNKPDNNDSNENKSDIDKVETDKSNQNRPVKNELDKSKVSKENKSNVTSIKSNKVLPKTGMEYSLLSCGIATVGIGIFLNKKRK